MSNKPFKLRSPGKLSDPPPSPPPKKPESKPKRTLLGRLAAYRQSLKKTLAAEKRQRSAAQFGLILGLVVLSGLYVGGLNEPATTVLARRRELPVYCVDRPDKVLSISFDASWGGDKTMDVLDILDAHQVKTTFFLVGGWVDKYPDLVKEIVARGHEIGNHSDTHAHMSQLGEEAIKKELRMMSDKVETLTGVRPTLFRPPYGAYNDRVVTTTRAEGYEVVQWSIDSLDWKDRGTADIIKQCTYRVDNGDIVLFHNDSKDIVNALPTVIKHYQGLGYQIIPVSEILLKGETTIDVQGKQHPVEAVAPKQ
jgi:polysaccharide deacetylase family sporulation protein PdaB